MQCILTIRVPSILTTYISYNLNMHLMVGANRAVRTGLAGPKEQVRQTRKAWQLPDQYSVHQPMQKCHMGFHGLLQFLLKEHAGRDLGRQLSSTQACNFVTSRNSPLKHKWKTIVNCSQHIVNTCLNMAVMTINNTDSTSDALFSSIADATESLGFSD